jgi:arylformamidase
LRLISWLPAAVLLASAAGAAAAAAGAAADKPSAAGKASPTAQPAKVERNVAYGPHVKQRFDAYLPAKPAGPVLFVLHGGAWGGGDKAQAAAAKVGYFVPRGYVVVAANYRSDAPPLEQAADAAAALAAAQKAAAGWGADPSRFVLVGEGGGGYLVTLLNSAPALARARGAQPWKAAVSFGTPVSNVPGTMQEPHAKVLDKVFGSDPAKWEAVSPMHLLERKVAPMLTLCSTTSKESCPRFMDLEMAAAKFRQHVTYWQQHMPPEQLGREFGVPGGYTESIEGWIRSVL